MSRRINMEMKCISTLPTQFPWKVDVRYDFCPQHETFIYLVGYPKQERPDFCHLYTSSINSYKSTYGIHTVNTQDSQVWRPGWPYTIVCWIASMRLYTCRTPYLVRPIRMLPKLCFVPSSQALPNVRMLNYYPILLYVHAFYVLRKANTCQWSFLQKTSFNVIESTKGSNCLQTTGKKCPRNSTL